MWSYRTHYLKLVQTHTLMYELNDIESFKLSPFLRYPSAVVVCLLGSEVVGGVTVYWWETSCCH
jgi:hypothetical protein